MRSIILKQLKENGRFETAIREVCHKLWKENVDIYVEKSDLNNEVTTYEIHFCDDNFYEIDLKDGLSENEIVERIWTDLIEERKLDLSTPVINGNNRRYVKKYMR